MSKHVKAKDPSLKKGLVHQHTKRGFTRDPLSRFSQQEMDAYSNWVVINQKIEDKIRANYPALPSMSMMMLEDMILGHVVISVAYPNAPVYEINEFKWFISAKLGGLLSARARTEEIAAKVIASGLVK